MRGVIFGGVRELERKKRIRFEQLGPGIIILYVTFVYIFINSVSRFPIEMLKLSMFSFH